MRERIRRFRERNEGAVLRKGLQEVSVRLWMRAGLRHLVGPMIPIRHPEGWIFIVGCYNSGTSILREILGAHPQIATLPREGVELTGVFPDLETGGWQRMWHRNVERADLSRRDPTVIAVQAMRDWAPWWGSGARFHLEKSIVHAAWMPALQAGFDNARFVGVIRNGLCASEGIRRRARPHGRARQVTGAEVYPIEEAGRQWVFANTALLRDRGELRRYTEIRYEDFTADPVVTIRELFADIGVDPEILEDEGPGRLRIGARRFHVTDHNAESAARLSDADIAALHPVIGPMMERLGYAMKRPGP